MQRFRRTLSQKIATHRLRHRAAEFPFGFSLRHREKIITAKP
ncbi:MAG: hypothetical protein ACJARR_003742 [Pseudophaeobacter arcticus]|jgi:hypothetical protein